MDLGTALWIITIVLCGFFLWISWRVQGKAGESFSQYAIGGGNFPLYLILFTEFATIMGVGNFVGHAGRGYTLGLPWMAFILGEQGSKIIFALLFAGIAGRFTYNTVAEMADDLFVRDKWTRAIAALLACCIMIAWVGGQGKAFGAIFNIATGADPLPIIIFFSVVFIIYTALGGIHSVVWTDLFQGIIVLVLGVAFYFYAFEPVNWSLTELGNRLTAMGKGELWSFSKVNPMTMIVNFVTATVGVLSAQIYWQRCFAAKSAGTARTGLLVSGCAALIMVLGTCLVGMIVLTLNPNLKADDAIPWLLTKYMPLWLSAMVFTLILAAGMSSADSNLNSATVLIVNDLIKPFRPDLDDQALVKLAKGLTVVVGVFACWAAVQASTILGLFAKAYAMAGGGLVPLLLVGFLWRERSNEPLQMGRKNSKITPWGARTGLVVGSLMTQLTALGPNRVLIALATAIVLIVVVSMMTRGTSKAASDSVSN